MKEFGKNEYEQTAYVNFERSKSLHALFIDDFDIERIITAIEIESGVRINAENTLIVFDEIQEAKGAITSLKYFHENGPQYHIISAGSLLGVAMQEQSSFPVGMVEFLDLFPLDYEEFLMAIEQQPLLDLILDRDWTLIKSFKSKLIQYLRSYYYIGGMPEAVLSFKDLNDFREIRIIQKRLLQAYENDFPKHAPYDVVPRIRFAGYPNPDSH